LHVIFGAAPYTQLGGGIGTFKTDSDFSRFVWVFGIDADGNLVVIPAEDSNISGTQVNVEMAAGTEVNQERMIRQVGKFGFLGLG
jgi:hypothetical protein